MSNFSLQDTVDDILAAYPALMVERLLNGELQIRRRDPGTNYKKSDVVATYMEQDYREGKLTELKIREDCERYVARWCAEHPEDSSGAGSGGAGSPSPGWSRAVSGGHSLP